LYTCVYNPQESQKTKIDIGEFKGMSVWDALHKRFKEEIAVSQMAASSMENVMHIAYDLCRILKATHPEYIPIIVLMAMPRSDKPWGSCSLLPGGLPVVKTISIDKINQLLQEMGDSISVAELNKSGEEQIQGVVVKKRKKSVDRGPPPRGRGALKRGRGAGSLASSSQALTNDDDDKEKEDQDKVQEELSKLSQKTFLAYLSSCCDFMVDHIDDRQKARVEAFRVIALYGLLHGEVKLMTTNGVEKPIKGLAALRKLFKIELYKFAKLLPRPSDVDFDLDGVLMDTAAARAGEEPDVDEDISDEALLTEAFDLKTMANVVGWDHLHTMVQCPVGAAVTTGTAMTFVMTGLFAKQASQGHHFLSGADACKSLSCLASEATMAAFPSSLDKIANFVDKLRRHRLGEVIKEDAKPLQLMLDIPMTGEVLFALRLQLFLHLIGSLGMQMHMRQEAVGGSKPYPYLTDRMHKMVKETLSMVEVNNPEVMKDLPTDLRDIQNYIVKLPFQEQPTTNTA
jgi:hypothetical protein